MGKRAALYVWCGILRETLCVPSIYRRVRVRSCTAGQVTSLKSILIRPMGSAGLPTAPCLRRDTSLKTACLPLKM